MADASLSGVSYATDPAAVGISADRLMGAVRDIAAFGNRIAGSEAEAATARYIAQRLTEFGIDNQIHEFEAFIHWPEPASIEVLTQRSPDHGSDHPGRGPLAAGDRIAAAGVAFARSTGAEPLVGQLANPIAGDAVRGKIAIVDGLAHYDVCVKAFNEGAIGVIGVSTGPQRHNWQISPLWGVPLDAQQVEKLSPVPAAHVSAGDGARLRALAQAHATIALTAVTHAEWRVIRLPVAQIDGVEPQYVLMGGHYCSWGPGATDNATGNALMLEIARLLAAGERPRYGVRFAWWSGHEQGGYAGSSWYADRYWTGLRRHAIAYFNVDNVGSRGATTKVLQNATGELNTFATAVMRATVGAPSAEDLKFKGWLRRRDKYIDNSRCGRNGDQSFSGIGLPSLQISSYLPPSNEEQIPGSGMGWWWHTADDLPEYAGPDVLAVDTLLHWNVLQGLQRAPVLPLDLVTVGSDVLASLREYAEAAPDMPELGWLQTLAQRYLEAARELERQPLAASAEARRERSALSLQVVKLLNPVLHHAVSDYDYDVTRQSRLLPGLVPALTLSALTGDARHMAVTGLRRRVNRIAQALLDATDRLANA